MYRKGERTFGAVTPENVMLIGKTIKLVDWGSSLAAGQGVSSTRQSHAAAA